MVAATSPSAGRPSCNVHALPDERRMQFVDNFSYTDRPPRVQIRRRGQSRPRLHRQPDAVRRHLHLSERAGAGPRPGDPGREELHELPAGLRAVALLYSTIDSALFAQDQWKPLSRAHHQLRHALGQADHAVAIRAQSGDSGDPETAYGLAQLRSARGRGLRPHRQRPHRDCAAATASTMDAFPTASSPMRCRIPGSADPAKALVALTLQPVRSQRAGVSEPAPVGSHRRYA